MKRKRETTMATKKKKAASSGGGAELKAFRAAVQNLKAAGSALARAAKSDSKLRGSAGLRAAERTMLNTARAIAKSIPTPTTPPSTPG
jgi:hypothetical protein